MLKVNVNILEMLQDMELITNQSQYIIEYLSNRAVSDHLERPSLPVLDTFTVVQHTADMFMTAKLSANTNSNHRNSVLCYINLCICHSKQLMFLCNKFSDIYFGV